MIVLGIVFGFFSETKAIQTIDFPTIFLLLAMMLLVAMLEPTGFFQFLAVKVGVLSQGKSILLLVLLSGVTFLVSMFLNSVTAIVLVAPVTILICELLGLNIQPFLLSETFLANLGGTATLVGSPPNILIGSAAHFTFIDFLTHSFPTTMVAAIGCVVLIIIWYKKDLKHSSQKVRALKKLNPSEALNDSKTAILVLIVIAFTVLLFILSDVLHISPALAAFIGAVIALAILRPSISETVKGVQWDMLIFFAALFIIIGGMDAAGVFREVASLISLAKGLPPVIISLIFLWTSALLSAFVVNIPIAIAFIPIIQGLGQVGFNITPIWWAVILGTGLGGNGTIVGSNINIVVATLSTKTSNPITSRLWNRRGLPITLATVVIASLLFIGFYTFLSK
jgi:Na+/H+ antiporter NhaD/arsenite permease-like protein